MEDFSHPLKVIKSEKKVSGQRDAIAAEICMRFR